ncbi:hypothetical protein ILYODFUR_018247 [Ilyodon furcidens]|uniref:Uncharacterized protein n=1 Tax=Ilyodon furcidens TaxID=33524 RepID=A0ABV0UJW7_9TELE
MHQAALVCSLALQRTLKYVPLTPQLDNSKGPYVPLNLTTGHSMSPWQQQPVVDSDHITGGTRGLQGVTIRDPYECTTRRTPPSFFMTGFFDWSACVWGLHTCTEAVQRLDADLCVAFLLMWQSKVVLLVVCAVNR